MPFSRRYWIGGIAALTLFCGTVESNASTDTVPLDRLTWLRRNPYPSGKNLNRIVAGPDCFIIHGDNGLILRSINGVLWNRVPAPTQYGLTWGAFLEGEFVLTDGPHLLTSTDGLAWSVHQLPLQDDGRRPFIYSVDRSSDRWVAKALDGLFVSSDGDSWEYWPSPVVGGLNSPTAGPDRILVIKTFCTSSSPIPGPGPNISCETTIISMFGPNDWTESSAPFARADSILEYFDGRYVLSGPGVVATSTNGEEWELNPVPDDAIYWTLEHSGAYWTLSTGEGQSFYESYDARTWTKKTCDELDSIWSVARRDPGIWVATGEYVGLATSTDGEHWTRRDSGGATPMYGVARVADRWVAVGAEGTVISSSDGLNWERQVIAGPGVYFTRVVSDGNILYAKSSAEAFCTTDGITWIPATTLPEMVWNFSGIPADYVPSSTPVWAGDRWLLPAFIPNPGGGAIFSSSDGKTWSTVFQSGLPITSVAGRPGAYVAASGGLGLFVSNDAVTWESTGSPDAALSVVIEGYGWFLAGTLNGILASEDGRNWERIPGILETIYGGARIGESFWFTGENGTIIEVTPHQEAPIANLSTRAYQHSDRLPTIAGFVIAGTEPLEVLVRAVGHGLRNFDIDAVIERPTIHLYKGQVETMTAGDWATSTSRDEIEQATEQTHAFILAEDSGDAALVTRLPPGAYTAIVEGDRVAQGNVLVEVYDSSSTDGTSEGGRLINSSTRGEAALDLPLIGGFVIKGDRPRRVLVRGIGPGLRQFGLDEAAPDPLLRIFSRQELIADNDDWEQTEDRLLTADAAATSGAFRLDSGSLDAAIVLTLEPGLYTAHVEPAKGSSAGEVLLEIYYLD